MPREVSVAKLPNDPRELRSPDEVAERVRGEVVADVTARLAHKGAAFARLFRDHPDGSYVLLCLKQEFLKPFDRDPCQNAYNTCAREMFEYIDRLIRTHEGKTHVAEAALLPASER